jgi:hypothetical protein
MRRIRQVLQLHFGSHASARVISLIKQTPPELALAQLSHHNQKYNGKSVTWRADFDLGTTQFDRTGDQRAGRKLAGVVLRANPPGFRLACLATGPAPSLVTESARKAGFRAIRHWHKRHLTINSVLDHTRHHIQTA